MESAGRPIATRRLQAEFALLYLCVPLAMAVLMPPGWMFPVLFGFTAVAAGLLHRTPGFRWRDLLRGWRRVDWRLVLVFAGLATLICAGTILWLRADAFLMLVRRDPVLLLAIFVFYPILSALPQEVVFRVLFFRRYGGLMPGRGAALAVNAGVFSFAHLMYWNWPALVLTFLGGLVFAWAYERQGNFPAAVLLHALAGWILFTLGLGVFFYAGFVERPF
jgi:membrane protease YdiL (CAAX protease family)